MEKKKRTSSSGFWRWTIASILFRLVLVYFPKNLRLSSRPEVSTPLTSLRRLAEGYWLKQSGMSPYAGSMYHGSPLLLSILGPLTVQRSARAASMQEYKVFLGGFCLLLPFYSIFNGNIPYYQAISPHPFGYSFVFILADIVSAMLVRAIGQKLQAAYSQSLDLLKSSEASGSLPSGDVAALIYLWNPFTIISCVGLSTSPIENMVVILALYGACTKLAPLAAFGWIMATHLSLYPAILVVPIILLLGHGPDAPPRKIFLRAKAGSTTHDQAEEKVQLPDQSECQISFSSRQPVHFLLWSIIWGSYILVLSAASVRQYGGLLEMLKSTYGFILSVEDLSPNMGVLWYFFAEVFDFFRSFFLIVFQMNILFMIVPLAIRLNHRPAFLAFVYIAVSSMFKSYPSVGDSALYMGLVALFINELSDMKFSFFLFCGYVGISLLSPVMHNLWIWRGTGNANFYFATGMAFACLRIILIVESVSSILNHDRLLTKIATKNSQEGKS